MSLVITMILGIQNSNVFDRVYSNANPARYYTF